MLIRLQNSTEIINLEDNLIDLSEWLYNTQQNVDYLKLLKLYLDQQHFVLKDEFLKFLKSFESLNLIEILKNNENQIRSNERYKMITNDIYENFNKIFESIIYCLSFIKDETLLQVIEFLRIPYINRSNNMFTHIKYIVQTAPSNTVIDLKTMVDVDLHPYIDFITKLSLDQVLQLAKAAAQLGIDSLIQLSGIHIACAMKTMSTEQIRTTFGVPDHYKHGVDEALQTKLKALYISDQQNWEKFI